MQDFLILELPSFRPRYRKWKKYGYTKPAERANLRAVLLEAGRGYCMYCYTRVLVAGKFYGHLEHAIEKTNSEELKECIPDIGLSCSVCNDMFKKQGERRRKIRAEAKAAFHRSSRCSQAVRKQCTVPCKALRELQRAYGTGEEAKILLQPFGVRGQDSGEELQIQYDVLKSEFQPAMQQHSYSQEEILFIQEHIGRFHLNDPQYRTGKLMEFIRNVIDGEGRMPAYEYNNLVVELFAEKLKPLERAEILKICEKIYIAGFLSA